MPRMSKTTREEMAFFINASGRIQYNDKCKCCINECQQSYRAEIAICPIYKSKRSKEKGLAD